MCGVNVKEDLIFYFRCIIEIKKNDILCIASKYDLKSCMNE